MEKENKKSRNAAEQASPANPNTRDNRQESDPGEGSYRDAETAASDARRFGDDYEVAQENEIAREEARTEKGNRTSKD